MLQNHIFQLFTLTAMEPPASLDAESIRDEKVKVLRSIATPTLEFLQKNTVRAQYGGGFINGKPVPAYRQEEKVAHELADGDVRRRALRDR
jgi:glucose-6-phosphate 1-dehydrogenase